jgi:hypothetical protein
MLELKFKSPLGTRRAFPERHLKITIVVYFMDVKDKGNYQIEVGLSAEDRERLVWGDHMLQERELGIAEKLTVYAMPDKKQRDRMVQESDRLPAEIEYAFKPSFPDILKERDKVYARGIGNGDVDIFMTQLTAMTIHPDGIIEMNMKIPQLLKQNPKNNVRLYVKIPF